MENATVPIFECPTCGKQELILLAVCEWMLDAVRVAHEKGFTSIAFPLIGAGSGGFNQEQAKTFMLDELSGLDVPMRVKIVVFKRLTS